MNLYVRLPHLQADVAGAGGVSALQAQHLRAIDEASREVERYCNRRFYSEIATRYFDGNGKTDLWLSPIPGEADLISVSALTVDDDDDGTYELTLVEDTDYRLMPANSTPKTHLQLLTRGTQLSYWPRGQASIKVVGTWGWSEETEDSGLTGTVATTTGTTLTASASAATLVYPGDTIIVESEQMYVSAVVTTAITVVRGINGTTAAAHSAKSILIRRYPTDIEEAVRIRVGASRWESNQGMFEGTTPPPGSYGRYRGLLDPFRLLVVA